MTHIKRDKKLKKAFSLMELMVVIIILGLLASLVMPNIIGKGEQAKQNLVCVQMESIANSLQMFKMDNGTYPDTEEGLEALLKNPSEEKYPGYANGYLEKMPQDPWKHRYIYVKDENGAFDLISLGADGKEGGEEENKDLRLSTCSK